MARPQKNPLRVIEIEEHDGCNPDVCVSSEHNRTSSFHSGYSFQVEHVSP